jgi:ER lumen protein retaining receptor
MTFNEFRLTGDFLHGFAILLLIINIIKTRSCHAISGITTLLYLITFTCRYLDLFPAYISSSDILSIYNYIFKIYYLTTTYLLLFFIYGLYRDTRDKKHNTFPIFGYLIIAHMLNWSVCYLTGYKEIDKEFFRRFSIYLEMFAIIPQLHLIYQQGTFDKMMAYYLMMLGSYRGFYVINWIYRYNTEEYLEPIAFFCGFIQTVIYLSFFILIYPRLNNGNKCQAADVTKDGSVIVDIEENINEKTKYNAPLIHNVV